MHRDIQSVLLHGCLVAAALGPPGCAMTGPDDPASDGVAVAAAHLTVGGRIDRWPGGVVPVCFHPRTPETVNMPEYAVQTERIRTLAEQEFEAIPNASIDFVGWDECPNLDIGTLAGTLRIIVAPTSATSVWFTRDCSPGTTISTTGDCSGGQETIIFVKGAYYAWGTRWDTVALHELGHALGTGGHEQDRSDTNDPVCPGNGKLNSTSSFLTEYDPESIMRGSYCSFWPGRLSALDQLGFELMFYDGPEFHPIAARSGFQTSQGLLLHSNDSVVTDWTVRGALPQVYDGTPTWNTPDVTVQDVGLAATNLPYKQPTEIHGTFDDFRNRQHGIFGTAVVDDGLHAALVMRIVM